MRIHTSSKKDGHEKQYSELLLFTNWRNEEEEFHPNSAKDCINEYNKRIKMIRQNKKAIFPGEGTIDLLENVDLEIHRPTHISDILDGEGQQQQEDDLLVGAVDDPQYESFAYTGNLAKGEPIQFESFKYRVVNVPKEVEMKHCTLRLVPEQMDVLRQVVNYCKDIVKSRIKLNHKVRSLKLIVHGGAGKKNFL